VERFAQTEPERVLARLCRGVNSRDWDAVADLYTEDFVSADHRPLGWEPMRGGRAMADFYRSWVEVVPDVQLRVTLLAGDDEHAVGQYVGWGHAADGGGEMEYVTINAVSLRDGRIRRLERFDPGDEAAALARLEELRAERQ
jgi:ketosteroid isomerase-like protein